MSGAPPARPKLAPFVRYRWDAVRSQHQLVYPESVMELNESGAAIAKLCDGRPFSEIVAELERVSGQDGIEADVTAFILELAKLGLVRDAS